MFGDRHHQQKHRSQQDKNTTQRPAPLAVVRCRPPAPHVADGPQSALTPFAGRVPASTNHELSLTQSAWHVEPAREKASRYGGYTTKKRQDHDPTVSRRRPGDSGSISTRKLAIETAKF